MSIAEIATLLCDDRVRCRSALCKTLVSIFVDKTKSAAAYRALTMETADKLVLQEHKDAMLCLACEGDVFKMVNFCVDRLCEEEQK